MFSKLKEHVYVMLFLTVLFVEYFAVKQVEGNFNST